MGTGPHHAEERREAEKRESDRAGELFQMVGQRRPLCLQGVQSHALRGGGASAGRGWVLRAAKQEDSPGNAMD